MRIKYLGSQKFILVLALWMLLCWVFGASAAEKWDAKTTARVNLRRNPSSNGVILSIVPKGHRVRIIEKQGLWCKIDVEGDIHGKGWVYAEYLEKILSKVPEADTNSQSAAAKMPLGERIERIHPANPPSSVRNPAEKQTQLHTPPPEKASRVGVESRSTTDDEFPAGKNESGTLSRVKNPTAGDPPHTAPAQASPEVRTEEEEEKPLTATKSEKVPMTGNKQHPSTQTELQDMQPKSTLISHMERPIIGKPIHVAPVQPPQFGIKRQPPEVIKKAFSEVPIQGNSIARPTDLPVEKKEPVTAGQSIPLELKERAVANTIAVEETAKQGIGVSYKRRSIADQESMGLVEIVLKLMSISLTALVILYLHRANKIAASHHEALMQCQNRLNTRG